MKKYRNLGGNSGVLNYESGNAYIIVEFSDRWKYTFSYKKAGRNHVEEMKRLAEKGQGLNSYIMLCVKEKWDSKSHG